MTEKEKKEYIEYIQGIRHSFKTNYYLESLKEIEKNETERPGYKPSLLLHVCCIVCACWPLEFLRNHFQVTILFNNSNIYTTSVSMKSNDIFMNDITMKSLLLNCPIAKRNSLKN